MEPRMSLAGTVPVALPERSRPLVSTSVAALSIPWTIWSAVAGIAFTLIGATWDFAWHMSIGRETYWIPPHILVQMGALLAGIPSAYAILATTFAGASSLRDASVQVLGLRGPSGAFIGLWGSLAMIASAPFDNWQHNAYGLDVTFVTPPHLLLFLGSFCTMIGAMVWMSGMINRSNAALQNRLVWLLLIVGSIGVPPLTVIIARPTWV